MQEKMVMHFLSGSFFYIALETLLPTVVIFRHTHRPCSHTYFFLGRDMCGMRGWNCRRGLSFLETILVSSTFNFFLLGHYPDMHCQHGFSLVAIFLCCHCWHPIFSWHIFFPFLTQLIPMSQVLFWLGNYLFSLWRLFIFLNPSIMCWFYQSNIRVLWRHSDIIQAMIHSSSPVYR